MPLSLRFAWRPWYALAGRNRATRLRRWHAAHTKATEVLMAFRFATAVTFALLLMSPSSGRTQVLMERDVSLRMALTIAETALAQCGVNTRSEERRVGKEC